jgi:hypothetical protein
MRLWIVVTMFGLCGCGMIGGAASPDYKAGYRDGCASAARGADPRDDGTVRDEAAYRAVADYRKGWGAGFNVCRNNGATGAQPTVPASGRGPIADPF